MSRDAHSRDETMKKHKGSDDCGDHWVGTVTGHVAPASGVAGTGLFLDLSRGYMSI